MKKSARLDLDIAESGSNTNHALVRKKSARTVKGYIV